MKRFERSYAGLEFHWTAAAPASSVFLSILLLRTNIGSSIDRVSGERKLLPSASERILCPLRFQETRGGSGVCHFGFKAHPPALLVFSSLIIADISLA